MFDRSPGRQMVLALVLAGITIGGPSMPKAQAAVQGGAPGPSAQATPALLGVGDQYLINPGDVLDLYVFDVPELSHTYPVSPSGTVTMPLLPAPVQATGLSPDQFARALEEAFRQSGRLQRPEISVTLRPSFSNSVAVEGAVKTPSMVSEMGRTRLADIITQCGGLADYSGTVIATVTRGPLALQALAREGGPLTRTVNVDLKKVMDLNDPAAAFPVWPGDRVVVESRPPVYYVLGEVKSPCGYTIKNGPDELTFLRALAMAGDVTSVAKTKQVYIIRKDPKAPNGREEIKISMASILKGRSPDPRVQAEDILFVPGSNAKKALHTIENAPGLVTTAAVDSLIIH